MTRHYILNFQNPLTTEGHPAEMNPLTTLIKETTQFLEQPAKVAKEVLDIIELPTKPAEMLINSLAHVSTQATAGRQEEDEMREPDPSTLDLSGYDDLYLCHSALALRIKRDTANQEELTSRGSALNQCQQALDASTTELQQLRLRLDDLGVTATNTNSLDSVTEAESSTPGPFHETVYLSRKLARCREEFWTMRSTLGRCINEREANSTLLKVNEAVQAEEHQEDATVATTTSTRTIREVASPLPVELTTPMPVNFRPYDSEPWISEPNEKEIHFRKRGQMLSSVTYVHLIMDIDLKALVDQGRAVCSILDQKLEHSNSGSNRYLDDFVDQLKVECKDMEDDFHDEYNVWIKGTERMRDSISRRDSNLTVDRFQRQVLIGGAIALGIIGVIAAGSYLFSHSSLASLSLSSYTNPVTIQQLQDHECRLDVAERSIHLLNETMIKIIEQEQVNHANFEKIDTVMAASHLFGRIQRHFDRVKQGLQQLHSGRLSTYLVNSEQMIKLMNRLEASLAAVGLSLVAQDVEYLFDAPLSYLVFANQTVRCFIHLAAHRDEEVLELLEYMPVPYEISQGHFLHLQPESQFLAISKDTQSFQLLDHHDLTLCHDVGRPPITYCQGSSVQLRRGYPSCLFSLYDQDGDKVSKLCNIKIKRKRDVVIQLSHRDLLVYHEHPTTMYYHCSLSTNAKDQVPFQGFRKIHLNPGCQATTNAVKLQGSTEVYLHSKLSMEAKEIDLSSFHFDDIRNHLSFSVHDLDLVGSKEGLKIKDIHALYAEETSKVLWSIGLVTGIMLLILIGCIVYCSCRCGCPCPARFCCWSNKRRQGANTESPDQDMELTTFSSTPSLRRKRARSFESYDKTPTAPQSSEVVASTRQNNLLYPDDK